MLPTREMYLGSVSSVGLVICQATKRSKHGLGRMRLYIRIGTKTTKQSDLCICPQDFTFCLARSRDLNGLPDLTSGESETDFERTRGRDLLSLPDRHLELTKPV